MKIQYNIYLIGGGLRPERIDEYLYLTKELSKDEIKFYASRWKELVKENTPLRTVISGYPVSVDEDFYDRFIEEFLREEATKEENIIGNIIQKYLFGVNYSWYEYRIQKMIEEGKIEIIEDHEYEHMKRIIRYNSHSRYQ